MNLRFGASCVALALAAAFPFTAALAQAKLTVELPATYSSLAPVFFSNAGMISLRIMSSNEPP
jgi:hypothetical protein